MPDAKSDKVKIFISYARDDSERVSEIYHRLKAAGFDPWIDSEDLLPGVKWKDAIIKAVREADLFLLCVSSRSSNRQGFIQREIKIAFDQLEEKTSDHIYFIPVRLEECELPERVEDFQCVNWFEPGAWEKLEKVLRIQAEKLVGKRLSKPKPPSSLKPPPFKPPANKVSFMPQYKTTILAVSLLGLALIVTFVLGYFITYRPLVEPRSTPTPIAEKSVVPVVNKEVLRYALESDGKDGFRFRFRAPSSGYLYVVGPKAKAKGQWVYLTNNPAKEMLVPSNQLNPNGELRFPGGDGFTVNRGEPARFTFIWSATRLESSEFFFASGLRPLTADEVVTLNNLSKQSESLRPMATEVADGATVITALSSPTIPVVQYIVVRWPR